MKEVETMFSKLLPLVIALGACHLPFSDGRVQPSEARDSIFKIETRITLDQSTKDEEGVITKKTGEVGWSGTAWIAADSGVHSIVITAGHVCETGDAFTTTVIDWESFSLKEVSFPIIDVKYKLISRDNAEIIGSKVLIDDDSLDLCSLIAPGNLGQTLSLASDDPAYNSHGTLIGAPTGLWGGNIAVPMDFVYAGRGTLWSLTDMQYWDGLGQNGVSGGPVMFDGQVQGVVTMGSSRYVRLMSAVPHDVVSEFLQRTLHKHH